MSIAILRDHPRVTQSSIVWTPGSLSCQLSTVPLQFHWFLVAARGQFREKEQPLNSVLCEAAILSSSLLHVHSADESQKLISSKVWKVEPITLCEYSSVTSYTKRLKGTHQPQLVTRNSSFLKKRFPLKQSLWNKSINKCANKISNHSYSNLLQFLEKLEPEEFPCRSQTDVDKRRALKDWTIKFVNTLGFSAAVIIEIRGLGVKLSDSNVTSPIKLLPWFYI